MPIPSTRRIYTMRTRTTYHPLPIGKYNRKYQPISRNGKFLPICIRRPRFVVNFKAHQVIYVEFHTRPSYPRFVSRTNMRYTTSYVSTIGRTCFRNYNIRNLCKSFRVISRMINISFNRTCIPTMFFIFNTSRSVTRNRFNSTNFPTTSRIVKVKFCNPIMSMTIIARYRNIPSSKSKMKGTLSSNSFFMSLPKTIYVSTSTRRIVNVRRPICSRNNIPLSTSYIFRSKIIRKGTSLCLFPLNCNGFRIYRIHFFNERRFRKCIEKTSTFRLFRPLLRTTSIRSISFFSKGYIFP